MRVVFISWWWPYPADNGSRLRIYNLLRQLASQHEVILLSFAEDDEATDEQIAHLHSFCEQVEAIPKTWFQPNSLKALAGFASPWPRSLIDSYSPQMAARVRHYCESSAVDCVIASQVDTLRYLACAPYIPAILEEVEVTRYYNRVAGAAGKSAFRARLTLFKVEQMLRVALQRGVWLTVVSEAERELIWRIAPEAAQVAVIPNGVDTRLHAPAITPPEPNTLIYPGAVTYSANDKAVRYFITEVLPLVHEQIPEATFTVTGGTGSVDVRDLQAQPGVRFTGYLPDIAPAVQSAWVTVVPLTDGGGSRLKILESMALGTPVISTSKGAEGLQVHPGEDILIADEPQPMADTICELLRNPQRRDQLARAGRILVEREYDWDIIGNRLLELVNHCVKEKVVYG